MAEPIARRVVVRGRVQGVNFRAATRQVARGAGVAGWIRNADDGTVHAVVEGSPEAVERVIAFMRTGPAHAAVTDLDVDEVSPAGATGFRIG